jgi:GNAT superfamily N-acetyltransferase
MVFFRLRENAMNIIDLDDKHLDIYLYCLEDWYPDVRDAREHKACWVEHMKGRGLRVKLAVEGDKTLGMIQYVPIEHGFAEGKDAYFVHCIWVHGHKQGIGDQRKRGIGKALLKAAEEDAAARGAKGMAVWGLSLPLWMKASWFKKQGYAKVDKLSIQVLLWKPFAPDAVVPRWIKQKKGPVAGKGVVTVTAFKNGWCPNMNIIYDRAKRASAEFGDKVEFRGIPTLERRDFEEWGIADALFIDEKEIRIGPPPSYEKIRAKIAKRVRKLPSKKGMLEVQG